MDGKCLVDLSAAHIGRHVIPKNSKFPANNISEVNAKRKFCIFASCDSPMSLCLSSCCVLMFLCLPP